MREIFGALCEEIRLVCRKVREGEEYAGDDSCAIQELAYLKKKLTALRDMRLEIEDHYL